MQKIQFQLKTTVAMLVVAVAASACASLPATSADMQVKQRVQQRWATLMARNFQAAYQFNTPAQKALMTEAAYTQSMGSGNDWLSTEVVGVTCEQQLCRAKVRIDVASPMPHKFGAKISTHVEEDWVLVDGEWWFSQK